MKIISKNIIFVYFGFLVLVIVGGCSRNKGIEMIKKNIQFSGLERTFLNIDSILDVKIIASYSNEGICTRSMVNANLYVCKDIKRGDTLYVFQLCDKVPWFVKEKPEESFSILSENVLGEIPGSVIVSVPRSFNISKNSRYIFSNITRLED